MSTDTAKMIVGGGLTVIGAATGNYPLAAAGAGQFFGGLSGTIRGDGGKTKSNLAARQQGMLIRNHTAVAQPIPVVYGRTRLGVIPVDFRVDLASDDDKDLYIPAVVCHGSRDGYGVAGFEEVYFNEQEAFDSTGTVLAHWNGKAFKTDILGTDTETWSVTDVDGSDLVNDVTSDWDTNDDGKGLAGILFKLVYDSNIYNGVPTITVLAVGNLVEDTRDEITGTINFNQGTCPAGPGTAEIINHADVSLGSWAAGDRVEVTSGLCAGTYIITSVSGDDITVTGTDDSACPMQVTSYSTTIKRWAHPDNGGDNPALCIRDYLLSDIYGMGNMISASQVDDTSFEAMANYYEESVSDGAGGSQQRFRCNGWVDTGKSVKQNLTELLSSCRGNLVYEGGLWRLFTTRSVTAETYELTQANIILASMSFANAGRATKYNIARSMFVNADDNYKPDEVQWPKTGASNTYLTADNGIESRDETDLPFTTDIVMAEQIAMIRVKESREGISCALTARESAYQLAIGDVVKVTHDTPGWTEKEFWVMGVSPRPDFTVDLLLQEYDLGAYSYDSQTTSSLAADTDLPSPFALTAPSGLTLTEIYRFVSGKPVPQILVEWTAPDHPFLTEYHLLAKRIAIPYYDSALEHNTSGYFESPSGAWHTLAYGFVAGDKIDVRGASTPLANDGVYTITRLDQDNDRIYVTPAPGTYYASQATWIAQINAYQSYGRVPAEQEAYLITPLDVAGESERWRVHLRACNSLGVRSHGAQNLIIVSDDWSDSLWAGTATTTTGQSDPDSGSNACLLEDDSAVAAENKYIGDAYNDAIEFEVDGPKRIGLYIKQGTASISAFKLSGTGFAPQSWVIFELTWSGMTWSITHDASSGSCKYTGTVVKCEAQGGDWYWVEFRLVGVEWNDQLRFDCYPAGTTVANTGTLYVYRLVAIDDDSEITVRPQTDGTRAGDVTIAVDVTSIDDGDSPYDVVDADESILVDASSGAVTVNLPYTVNAPRRVLRIKALDATNTITIAAKSGETTEVTTGLGTGDVATLVADAANAYWRLMGS